MIKIEAEAKVIYTCTLTEEDENKVRNFAKEENLDIEEAVESLWNDNEIDIYAGEVIDSGCDTGDVNLLEDCKDE